MDKDILDDAKEDFKRAYDAESEQRKVSQDDLEFAVLGKQWPDDVEQQRKNEGRPCLTINRLPAFLKQVTNDSRLNRPAIHVKPTGDGASQETAKILNDLIRNIWVTSQGDVCSDTALDFAAAMGFGYMKVIVDYACNDAFEQDIMLERVSNPFSIVADPDSTSAVSDDWNLAFETEWYSEAKFKAKFGKDAKTLGSFEAEDEKDSLWYEGRRIRVAKRWTRSEVETELVKLSDGKIMQADEVEKIKDILAVQGITIAGTRPAKTYKVKNEILSAHDVLEENDWLGKYIPIVPMYGEEWNINGRRHFISLVRRAKDPQRMFNYWRTASTELVALAPKAPFIGPVGAFATDPKWATANTKSHAYIEYDPVPGEPPPQRQAFAGVPAGALQEALNASDDMKSIMGIYDASLGARSNETSGKAINARKQEGDVSTFNFMDNRNRCVEHAGRIIVDLIPQVYNVPRIMRGIKEDGSSYNVPVNQPVVQQQQKPDQPPQYSPQPEHLEGITQIFDLTVGKYDVVVDAGPSFTTRREETAEQMMEFIRVFPQSAPLIGDLLAKNLDWPGAEQVAERLRAMLPPQAQGQIQPVVQQLQQALQQQGAHAQQELQKLSQQVQKLTMDLAAAKGDNQVAMHEADTKRIQALADAYSKGLHVTMAADGSIQGVPLAPPQALQPQTPPNGGVPASGGPQQ